MNGNLIQRPASSAGPGLAPCTCSGVHGPPRTIVLTGGPGTGKTAVLELARHQFCRHVVVLAESASLLFGGGFPRSSSIAGRKAAQRAIYHVQAELELVARDNPEVAVVLCDRGTLDGLAYWPEEWESFWRELGTSRAAEMARYDRVVCLQAPPLEHYNRQNPLRIETAQQAGDIGRRLEEIWLGHPNLSIFSGTDHFLEKAGLALDRIAREVPGCCRAPAPHPEPLMIGKAGTP